MKKTLLTIVIAISIGLFAVSCNNSDKNDKTKLENIDESFDEIISSNTPVLVDFYADWCGPCKTQAPIIEELKEELGDKVRVVKVDVDIDDELAEKYGIQSIPTIIIFKDGEILWKAVGVQDKETLKKVVLGDTSNEIISAEPKVEKLNFDVAIQSDIPVIIDFYADWCKPCKVQGTIIEELKVEMGDKFKVLKVNVDYEVALAERFGIQSIPTLLVFKEGEMLWKAVGTQEKETLKTVIEQI